MNKIASYNLLYMICNIQSSFVGKDILLNVIIL